MLHPLAMILLKLTNVFCGENVALFMVTSTQGIQKSTKNRSSETKHGKQRKNQGSNRSKDREIELINREV